MRLKAKRKPPIEPLIQTDKGGIYMCHYCCNLFPKVTITKDHVQARSKGGANHKKNYVPSCQPCNWLKADIPYDKFKSIMSEFGSNMTRVETPESSFNHSIVEGGLTYYLKCGKPKVILNGKIGYGSRILTTVVVKTKLYIFISVREVTPKE